MVPASESASYQNGNDICIIKGTLIGVAPSTCSRLETDNQATRVKLLIGVALFIVTVTKAFQLPLDILSRNTKLPFSGTNSVVSGMQDDKLLLLHGVLASKGLETTSFLTISKQMYRCHQEVLLIVSLCLVITFLVGLPTGHLTGSSDIVLRTV